MAAAAVPVPAREVETKLSAAPGFAVPDLMGVRGVAAEAHRSLLLDAVYWDTSDLVLARHGVTLRRRSGDGPVTWTLKLPTADEDGRWEVTVGSRAQRVPPALRDLLVPWLLGAQLRVAVEVRTARAARVLLDRDGRQLCEVVDDSVRAVGGTGAVWRELEVEVISSASVSERVVRALARAGAAPAGPRSKAQQALGVLEERPPVVGPDEPAGLLVHRVLGLGLRDLRVHDSGVRTGRADAVHQMRVSCRRLRSELLALRALVDDRRVAGVQDELRWLAGELGAARDIEVLRRRLAHTAAPDLDVSVLDHVLAEEEPEAASRARDALSSPRYVRLLSSLAALQHDVLLAEPAARRSGDVLPRVRRKAGQRLAGSVRALDIDSPDELWHDARKAAKHDRYVQEAVATALGGRGRAQLGKRLQALLGEHTDAVVAEQRLRSLAEARPDLALLCGQLVERERSAARAVRAQVLA